MEWCYHSRWSDNFFEDLVDMVGTHLPCLDLFAIVNSEKIVYGLVLIERYKANLW
jgi:hypothetical protein